MPTSLAAALRGIGSQHATGIYITQNPVDPDLLARANNRLQRKPKHTTTDADIIRLAHLTLDFDPVRKSGISSTDAELAAALAQRDAYHPVRDGRTRLAGAGGLHDERQWRASDLAHRPAR